MNLAGMLIYKSTFIHKSGLASTDKQNIRLKRPHQPPPLEVTGQFSSYPHTNNR